MEPFWQEKNKNNNNKKTTQPYSSKTKPKKTTHRCSIKQFLQLSLCCLETMFLEEVKELLYKNDSVFHSYEDYIISPSSLQNTGLKWVLSYTGIINVEPSWYSQTVCLVPETAFLYLSLCCIVSNEDHSKTEWRGLYACLLLQRFVVRTEAWC